MRLESRPNSVSCGVRPPEILGDEEWIRLANALRLSPRERDVLRWAFYDERVGSIALRLGVSESTVNTYRERLFRKLDVSSCTQAVSVAFAVYLQLSRTADFL